MSRDDDINKRRESQRGRSVKDAIGASRDMLVIRAVVGESPSIGQMDYVFCIQFTPDARCSRESVGKHGGGNVTEKK